MKRIFNLLAPLKNKRKQQENIIIKNDIKYLKNNNEILNENNNEILNENNNDILNEKKNKKNKKNRKNKKLLHDISAKCIQHAWFTSKLYKKIRFQHCNKIITQYRFTIYKLLYCPPSKYNDDKIILYYHLIHKLENLKSKYY